MPGRVCTILCRKAARYFAARNAGNVMRETDQTRRKRRGPRKAGTVLALPNNLKFEDILWVPDEIEVELDRAVVRQKFFEAELRRVELLEQREWYEAQTRRLALVALELDETARKIKLQEEMDRTDAWWAATHEREKAQTAELVAAYQKQMDGGVYEAMVERAKKAQADMNRDTVRLERLALLSRGAVRGRRNS
jgi:hypothetical protein